jgi:hypothetical protein
MLLLKTDIMNQIEISINPFAEYLEATELRRISILKEQMKPDKRRIPYYQLAKARIKLSILNSANYNIITNGIRQLKEKQTEKKWQIIDRKNSILALEQFKEMVLPEKIIRNELEEVKTTFKYINLYGVNIKISPNLIFRITINGKKEIGACKIYTAKGKPFSNSQSKVIATLLYQFLSEHVAKEDEYVNPELCFCVDVFAGTTINSGSRISVDMKNIKFICAEIPRKWDIAKSVAA